MYFKHIYDPDLAQGSYLIGCQASGDAIVVDARRDIGTYLDLAERENLRIVAVTETHIHADYLSGSRELAAATGATLFLSDEGDDDWKYGFDNVPLYDGDAIELGNIRLTAVHTPGHTPEHLSFLVTDGAAADEPGYLLTGDFVFVGDVGRPDLLDEAAGGIDTRFAGARALFESLRTRFLTLPDYVQVWPGHGAGSACGKALGAVPSTTVGYERTVSWWAPYVQANDEQGFVDALLEGQPDAPSYFGRMKRWNKAGPAVLGERGELPRMATDELAARLGGDLVLIDTRGADAVRADGIAGALHAPAGRKFATYASYVVDPETDDRGIVVLAGGPEQAATLRDKLAWTGIDRVVGYVDSLAGLPRDPIATVEPSEVASLGDPFVLDVRTANEHAAGHIPGATQIHAGRVAWRLSEIPDERTVLVHCQSGARAAVVASLLKAAGYDVVELAGSYAAWEAWHEAGDATASRGEPVGA